MKRYVILLMISALTGIFRSYDTSAQTIQSDPAIILKDLAFAPVKIHSVSGLGKTTSCGTDTINYPFWKATTLQGISLNAASSGNAFAQWYPAPQPITVSGFDFYAWVSTGTNAVVTLTCRMYNSTFDSLPTGNPLASVTINVDSTFGGGSLNVIRKKVVFGTPVTTSSPYVLTIETTSSTNVSVVANSWTASPPNGKQEWLSSVKINTAYVRGYNVNVGTFKFDADFIFHPYVSYSLTSSFVPSPTCFETGVPVTFTNTSSPVLFSKFYSIRAFQNILFISCIWDYGDSSGQSYSVNGNKVYYNNYTYPVKLKDTLYGFTTGCADQSTVNISPVPAPTNATNSSPHCLGATLKLFADTVPGATYYWTGPNNFSSTQQNPVLTNVTAAMGGFYSVRTIIGQCSSSVAQTFVSVVASPSVVNNAPVCSGLSLTLSASQITGATYAWTGPNGFTSTSQSPTKTGVTTADSGVYSVTITAAGCGTIGPINSLATVNAVPAAPVASNNGPLCVGDNLNLTSSNNSGALYSWTGPANFSSNQQNPSRPTVQNSFAGTYSVIATKNGCSSQAGSTTLIVNNIPNTPTAGNNGPLCTGQSLSLTATAVAGATYSWSGPNSFTSTSQNPTRSSLALIDAGTYSVIATVNGCPSATATTPVVITTNTPTPTAGSNGPLCPGQNLQLTASNIPGASYSWTGPNSFTSTQQNPGISNVSSTNAGLYSVTAVTSGCGTSSAGTVSLVVNSVPGAPSAGNNGPLCDGNTLNLVASTITGATYYWSGPNGFTSNSQNPTVSSMNSTKAGQYSVYVVVSGCGTSSSNSTQVVVHAIPQTPTATAGSSICTGDSIALEGISQGTGPNATYTWTGPLGFSSGLKKPVIYNANSSHAGTYYLTVSDSGCSSDPGNVSVSIKSLPAAPNLSSNAPICAGSNLLLDAKGPAGASFAWTGPKNFQSTAQSPIISGATSDFTGTFIAVSKVNGCSSAPATLSVLINSLPPLPVADNNGPKCLGDAITLSVNSIPGATYNWTGPGGFSSTQQNPVLPNLTTTMAGTYNVTAISTAGCLSQPGSTAVVVNSFPAPPSLSSSPSGPACTGDSLQLYAVFISGATYEWSGPAGFGSVLQNPVRKNLTSAHAGTYSCTITKGGCSSQPATINISVIPAPVTGSINGLQNPKSNEIRPYSVASNAGSTYAWTVTGGTIQSGQGTNSINIKWNFGSSGLITVKETNAAGCVGQPTQLNVSIITGVETLAEQTILNIHPNPATGKVFINLEMSKPVCSELRILNMLGQETGIVAILPAASGTYEADISRLKAGVYFVSIETAGSKRMMRLVVE